MSTLHARIVQGIGYGALAVATIGLAAQIPAEQPTYYGGGGSILKPIPASLKKENDEAFLIAALM